ncbi:MAG: hypothetical protein KIT84_38160 [Labilithrix sp.]|nr:hypothetical protein [Labilithrix sp.]MCW5816884.1 hypothetical protein [Labilithrix sp.]
MDRTKGALLRHMVRARAVSVRMVALQRAGKIGYHASSIGDEAVVVGATLGAGDDDWIFPSVRDWAAALTRGMPLVEYVHHAFGSKDDPAVGHSAPDHVPARAYRIVPPSGVPGAHLPQAVGAAWAAKTKKERVRAVVLFGPEAVDTGDFHNALNFAGVFKAPVVFVARAPVASRAVAYGLASAKVDGGDAVAVQETVAAALAREGATLIEAVPPRFSSPELTELGPEDPITRLRASVSADTGGIEQELDAAIAAAEAAGPPAKSTLFDHVYAEVPRHLEAQLRNLS